MNEKLTLLIAFLGILISTPVATVIVACLQRHWMRKDKETAKKEQKDDRIDAMVDALRILMVDKIRRDVKEAAHEGSITPESKNEILEQYQVYKALKGNGHLDPDMEALDNVPVVYK